MPYRIAHQDGEYCVLNSETGQNHGCHPTEAEAQAQMRALYANVSDAGKTLDGEIESKAVWDTAYVNSLPDSAFLFIESGGEHEDGKTTPRSKRHFPVRDASGAIDAAHLRNAIARIPQSDAPGLDKAALQGRARRMLANLDGASKTVDTEALEWQQGAVPRVYGVLDRLSALPDRIATGQQAAREWGRDVKSGQMMRPDEIEALRAEIAELKVIVDMAELAATGAYDRGRSARWRQEIDLLELAV